MCRETTTIYLYCVATSVRTVVCLAHIDHTRLQIDNAPCSKLKREVEHYDSGYCYCRDGGSCRRRATGVAGDGNHSWSFEQEGSRRAKIESMEERAKRRLKEISNEIRYKKNELSFLKHVEAEKNQASSKRRRKNDKSSEEQEVRPASEPPESSIVAGEVLALDAEMKDGSATTLLCNPPAPAQQQKTKKMRELEREIDDLYQTWIARGGKEEGHESKPKPKPAWQKPKSDTYRPGSRSSSDTHRSGRKKGDSRLGELLRQKLEKSCSETEAVTAKQENQDDIEMK